ncbi:hypothetical protein F5883DRAFT_716718 [Diaporthe sp. PMI_573]|nr:hypothetical protein F5883DRAFT_716718 [Diaporthaceae sp. PMI_573]
MQRPVTPQLSTTDVSWYTNGNELTNVNEWMERGGPSTPHMPLGGVIFKQNARAIEDTREQTAVYTVIPPEHVASLTVQPCRVPEVSSSSLSGLPALCLHLSMSEPTTIVGPAAAPYFSPKPKTAADSRLLTSLDLLARLHSLVLYIKEDAFPDSAPQVLSNISTFKSSPKHADLKCLYEGRGGRPVCWPALEMHIRAPTSTTDSPPAYNDAEVEMQLGPHLSKRQRRGEGLDSKNNAEAGGSSSSIVDRLLDRVGRIEARLTHMETELREAKAHDKASDELDDLSAHMDDYVVVKMDDHMDFVKIDLQDFVEDRLADVEDRVMDRVQGGESIHDFHGIDQYVDFNPRQRQSTRHVVT